MMASNNLEKLLGIQTLNFLSIEIVGVTKFLRAMKIFMLIL